MSQQRKSLREQLDDEAWEAAVEHFGQNVSQEQIKRVRDCEWSMFTYHCATGDDLDCVCGAHASLLRASSTHP
jgi:hypothetical protein